MKTAKIAEIFKSIQGEGPYMGEEQVFVRFFGCNISCVFCDTHLKDFKEYTCRELKRELSGFKDYASLCLTGGEPLCQATFIRSFLEENQDFGGKIYLETNGTLPCELLKILDFVDVIAMDFKLASSSRCGSYLRHHEEFLKRSLAKRIFMKMVICKQTRLHDILEAAFMIKRIKPDIDLILQPNWFEVDFILLEKLHAFKKELGATGLGRVSILPQAHKFAGVR